MTIRKPHMFVKLVICTTNSQSDFDFEGSEFDRIHSHLVTQFSKAFRKLVLELELLDIEVFSECYVDGLIDRDYKLSVSANDEYAVVELVEKFHEEAEQILVDLPEIWSAA